MAGRLALSLGYLLVGCCVVTVVTAGSLTCQEEGRFPHPDDCGSYVDCFETADGELVARVGDCHGYPYSPEKRSCVDHSEIPDCTPKRTRAGDFDPAFDYKCETDGAATGCVNCDLAFSCINGKAVTDACDDSSVCEISADTITYFGGSVCLPPDIEMYKGSCKCIKVGLGADPFNSTYYHYCASATTEVPDVYACPDGKIFNDVDITCEYPAPTEPEFPSCDGKFGSFVNPNDCSWYYTCLPGGIQKTAVCDSEHYFDEPTGLCKAACATYGSVSSPSQCDVLGIGNSPHPTDCSKYLFCTTETAVDPTERPCQPGYYFNPADKKCSVTDMPSSCEEFNYLTCPGHADMCP